MILNGKSLPSPYVTYKRPASVSRPITSSRAACLNPSCAVQDNVQSAPSMQAGMGYYELGQKSEQGLRGNMEDELHAQWDNAQGYLYLGCYDGHGGIAAAQWLKAQLHHVVALKLKEGITTGADVVTSLASAFLDADKALLEHVQGDDELEQTGSTATVAIVKQNNVSVANVGDSQAYIMRSDRSLVSLTTPHRVYGPKSKDVTDEVNRVKAAGGWIYDGRVCNILAVSRAFGDWEFKGSGLSKLLLAGVQRGFWPQEYAGKQNFTADPVIVNPATASADLTEEDEFLVVSTDGLWDVMPPKDAMLFARKELMKGKRPQQVAEILVQTALKRYSTDNISTFIVDFKDPEYYRALSSAQGPRMLSVVAGGGAALAIVAVLAYVSGVY